MKHISMEEFTNEVISRIKRYLPECYENAVISTQCMMNAGGGTSAGISIQKRRDSTGFIFSVHELYEDYLHGVSFDVILKDMHHRLIKRETVMPYNTYVLEWNQVKDRIIARFINLKHNVKLVENRLVKPVQNTELGIIYDIAVSEESGQRLLLAVTHEVLERIKVSDRDVDEVSRMNTPRLCPLNMQPLSAILSGMGIGTEPLDGIYPIWVITNEDMMYGSIAVTYPGVEEQLKHKLGEFYLIPSSAHEMLAVNRDMATSKELSEIICSVNCTEVEENDILDSIPYVLEQGILKPASGWGMV